MKDHSDKILINLKKARSHIDKIIQMIEEDEYCIDVLQQLNAVIGYLKSTKNHKLAEHLRSCFVEGMKSSSNKKKKKLIEEVIKVTRIAE